MINLSQLNKLIYFSLFFTVLIFNICLSEEEPADIWKKQDTNVEENNKVNEEKKTTIESPILSSDENPSSVSIAETELEQNEVRIVGLFDPQEYDFNLVNKTSHFLEITIIAEQDEEFRMTQTNSNQIVPISNDTPSSNGLFAWAMESLLNTFTGSKLHEIRINLPANSEAPMDIRCTSTLSFNTNIKSTQYCNKIVSSYM